MTARLEHSAPTGDAAATPSAPRRTLASSAAVMASGTLVSRVLGLLRNALLVAVVGVVALGDAGGSMADSWSVANKLPNIISMLLAGGILNAVLVPQVVRAMRRPDGGEEHVNRLLTVAIAVLLGITVVLTAAAALLISLYAGAFPAEWKAVAVALAYWCIPQLFFYGLYTLLGQVLNARSIFGPYMWAPAVNNVVAIAGLVAFLVMFGGLPDGGLPAGAWTADRITLLAGTATLGVVAQALVLVVPLYRSGFRFRPVWGLRGHGLGKASSVALWAFAALAVGQLGFLAVSNVAAAASARDYAGNFAYDNAFLIFMLPQSLVTVSLVTALFTRLSTSAAARDGAKVREDLSRGLRTLAVFTVFATAAFAVLAIPLVQVVLLDRADFVSYRAVGAVLVAMSLGLVSIGVWTMVQRVFYAYEDTRTLFRIQVPMAAILAAGSALSWWLLEPQWWVVGTGAATTLSNTVGATVGYLATRKYLPSLDGPRVLRTHLRVLLATIPTALGGWALLHLWGVETSFVGALLRVVVLGGAMLVSYLLLIRALRVAELDELLGRLLRPLSRLTSRLPAPVRARLPRTMAESGGGSVRGGERRVTTTGSATSLHAGDLVAGRYRLEHPVSARVPHATAWAATDTTLTEPVRVVLLDGPQRDHAVDATRRAALIGDPRLPRVLRAGVEGDQGYVVTEETPGVTLAELVRSGPLPPSQARALVGEAAAALETARRRGVHHLALRPAALLRTDDGSVRVLGLGTEAAVRGIERGDARAAAREDAVGLVRLLYAALTGAWPGPDDLADGLPVAPTHGTTAVPVGDLVANVPNDLDTLCAVTLGEHDDGPFTPGELVADLAPWGAIEVDAPAGPLPPVLPPSLDAVVPLAPAAGGVVDTAEPDDDLEQTAVHSIDTSGWAPHPLPTLAEPTPFADLVTDTGTIPAVRTRPHHASPLRAPRPGVTVPLPAATPPAEAGAAAAAGAAVAAAGAVAGAADGRSVAEDGEPEVAAAEVAEPAVAEPESVEPEVVEPETAAPAVAEAVVVEPEVAETAEPEAPDAVEAGTQIGPEADLSGAAVPDAEVADADAAPRTELSPAQILAGLPLLTRSPSGWDVPGGAGPERLPEAPERDEIASPAMRTGTERAEAADIAAAEEAELPTAGATGTAAAVGLGAAATRFATGLGGTNRRINEVGERVTGSTRQLLHGAGERLGSLTGRAGAYVNEVREEFRPVEEDDDGRPRFNPAPIVLSVMIALVVFGMVMSVLTLRDAATAFTPGPNPGEVPPAAEEPTTVVVEPTTPPPPSAEPENEDGPPAAANVPIAEGVTFDPSVSGGENQDNAYLAYDGNPDTTWNSLRYNSPTYGMKPGIGYTVVLEETALVSSVTLDVRGEGGLVEIRAADPDAPDQGPVLASGAMGPDVTYTFSEPVEAETIALWFPELPVADSDGRNRIELAEISLR